MAYGFLDIAATPSVQAVQARMGVDHVWKEFKGQRAFDRFTESEAAFIADRNSFYMATVSETGWPYVQHRGGPRGFLKLVDDRTLAFADYRGNRQYISTGNLAADDRSCLPDGLRAPRPAQDLCPCRNPGTGCRPGAHCTGDDAGLPGEA